MKTKYAIARPINGISLNGDELALTDNRESLLLFDSREKALEYLNEFTEVSADTEEDLEKYGIHIKEITFEKMWKWFGDVPINEDEEIEERFYHFPEGTDRFEIWHWFEETFDVSIGDYQSQNSS